MATTARDGYEERDRGGWDVATNRAAWWGAGPGEVEPIPFSSSLIHPAKSDVNKNFFGRLTASPAIFVPSGTLGENPSNSNYLRSNLFSLAGGGVRPRGVGRNGGGNNSHRTRNGWNATEKEEKGTKKTLSSDASHEPVHCEEDQFSGGTG
jgi:hypothetical protein